jgi:hypothetical protein
MDLSYLGALNGTMGDAWGIATGQIADPAQIDQIVGHANWIAGMEGGMAAQQEIMNSVNQWDQTTSWNNYLGQQVWDANSALILAGMDPSLLVPTQYVSFDGYLY